MCVCVCVCMCMYEFVFSLDFKHFEHRAVCWVMTTPRVESIK